MDTLTHKQADAITTAINYEAQIAACETDPGAWLAAVRGFAKTELKRLGELQPQRKNMICNAVESQLFAANALPSNYTGFKNYILALREYVETDQRDAQEDSAWKAFDPAKSHVIYCYRVAKEKTHYRIFSRVTHTNFVIDDPQIIDQLEAIKPIKHLKHNQMVDADYQVTWRYQPIEGTNNYSQIVVKVEKSVLDDDEKLLIQDMIAYITEQHANDETPRALIEVTANIPDNMADRALLESLYRRGWVWKTNQTNLPLAWGITELATREVDVTAKDQLELSLHHKAKRIACGKPPDAPMEESLSSILKMSSSMFFSTGGTLERGKELVDAEMNPQIEAYEKSKAEQPSKPLDEAFPRSDADAPPVSEGKMLSESKSYFAEINTILKDRGLEAKFEVFRTRIQGGESASKIPIAKRDEFLNKLEFILNDEYPNADSWKAWLNTNRVSKDVETPALLAKMSVQKLSEYKGTLTQAYELLYQIRQNTQQSNDEATPRNEAKIDRTVSERTETPNFERSSAASQVNKSEGSQNHMNEAPYSITVEMYTKGGKKVLITARGETKEEIRIRLKDSIELADEFGFTETRPGETSVTADNISQFPPNPHQQSNEGGDVGCAMIKVGTAYQSTKPQLQFECDGMEHTLNFTKETGDMVRLLANIRKQGGSPFTVDDFVNGKKFGGNWIVNWKAKEKNGKTVRDVLSVRSA